MNKSQRNLIIAVIAGVLIYLLLPEAYGLTDAGIRLLAVFIPTIFMWITCGTGWTSFLSVTVAVLLCVTTGSTAYNYLWGNIVVAAVIPFMMIASVLEESSAFEYIVKWIISRKFIHGHPTLFMIMFTLAMIIISIFTAPQVVAVLFFNLLHEVCDSIGYSRDSGFYKSHGLLIGWISQICDGILIWGRPYVLTCVALVVGLGFSNFTAMNYFSLAGIYLVLVAVIAMLIIKLWMRPDVSKFSNFDDAAMRESLKANPMSKQAKYSLIGMVFILICYMLSYFTFLGGVATYFSNISIAASVTLVCALMCVITVDGKPIMDLNKAAAKVPWSMIIFLGAIMFYASVVSSDEYGISACLQAVLGPVFNKIPIIVAMVLGLILASFLTNLCSNTVSAVVVCSSVVPALLAISGSSPAQVLAFACCVIALCGTAICTVSAAPTMSIVYSDIGIEYAGTAKYSITLCAIMIVISAVLLIPLGTVLFAGIV